MNSLKKTSYHFLAALLFVIAAKQGSYAHAEDGAINASNYKMVGSLICSAAASYIGEDMKQHLLCATDDCAPVNIFENGKSDFYTSWSAALRVCKPAEGTLRVSFAGSDDPLDFLFDALPIVRLYPLLFMRRGYEQIDKYISDEQSRRKLKYSPFLEHNQSPPLTIEVTGHSLGGYLAYDFAHWFLEKNKGNDSFRLIVTGFNSLGGGVQDNFFSTQTRVLSANEYRCKYDLTSGVVTNLLKDTNAIGVETHNIGGSVFEVCHLIKRLESKLGSKEIHLKEVRKITVSNIENGKVSVNCSRTAEIKGMVKDFVGNSLTEQKLPDSECVYELDDSGTISF